MKPILFIAALLFAAICNAQTPVSGGIYSNTTWTKAGSPYIVSGNVVLFDNVTLTLQPGTKIVFDDGAGMEVRGKLFAFGTANDSIYFTGKSEKRSCWLGLHFISGKSDTSSKLKMYYCFCGYAKELFNDDAQSDAYTFKHCLFY